MKRQILFTLYDIFDQWNKSLNKACTRGCSGCCTQNVTMTAVEGEAILRFIVTQDMTLWLAEKLSSGPTHQPPTMTTNQFAAACLEGRDISPDTQHSSAVCPFLDKNLCRIYPVRPFSCRLFISQQTCSALHPALVDDFYLEAATAVTQIIEHLGQKEYWGNMLDVLPALLDISEFKEIAEHLSASLIIQARMRTMTAQPLPGFLISEEHMASVSPLLQRIFDAEVEGKRVEDRLNGR